MYWFETDHIHKNFIEIIEFILGLDHVARIVSGNESTSSKTADQLSAQHSAIKMLAGRVKLILEYVKVSFLKAWIPNSSP